MQGTLVVEDGTTAEGVFFGTQRQVFGELVFNTNMTGYTEALTDPSYRGQILMMTYPLIGNYGVDLSAMESREIQVTGFVVKEVCPTPSHPRAAMGVDRFLTEQGRPGLSGVGPRMLPIKTRTQGPMRATPVRPPTDIASADPLLGISLGHPILGIAFGASTYKLKFSPRGGNQPVKDL